MPSPAWKTIPELPGYKINELGHVRNTRGYVVAHGKGARLLVDGKSTYFSRGALRSLAKALFADPLMPEAAPEPQVPVTPPSKPRAERKPHVDPANERLRDCVAPEHVRPVGDPWATGAIEPNTPFCWGGIL